MDFYPRSLLEKHGLTSLPVAKKSTAGTAVTNIDWVPDLALFEKRVAKLSSKGERSNALPTGWPTKLSGPLTWNGSDLEDEEIIYKLSDSQIQEIEQALSDVKSLDFEDIGKETFSLPTLGPVLENFSNSVHGGRGFFVLKGLKPASYSREENVMIFLGISSYIAEIRARQNLGGSKLIHITDVNVLGSTAETRSPIYSNKAQPFHADVFCDVLALFYLNAAGEGGENLIASSWKVYNELAATRPDIIQLLAQDDWAHDTYGCNPSYTQRPLLFYHDKKVILNYSRRVLTGAPMKPRSQELPSLTEAQAEALDAVHFCALKHSTKLRLETGNMLFVNNLAVIHSRTTFRDDERDKRYVLRLWLNNPGKAWQIPPGLQLEWERLYGPLEEVEDYFDIDPFNDQNKLKEMVSGGESSRCG